MTPRKAATFEGYLEKSHPTDPSHPNLSIHLSNGIGAAWAIHCKPPGRLASVTVTSPHHWLKVLNFPETACRFAHQSWETATFRDCIFNPLPSVIIQWPTKFLPYKLDPKSAITHLHDHSQYLSSTLGSVTSIISLKFQTDTLHLTNFSSPNPWIESHLVGLKGLGSSPPRLPLGPRASLVFHETNL